MLKKYTFLGLVMSVCFFGNAQSSFPAEYESQGTFVRETIALRDAPSVEISEGIPENLTVVPNNLRAPAKVNQNALPVNGDPLAQTNRSPQRDPADILQNFEGLAVNQGQGFVPPDPTGAVGPDHYVQAVNSVIRIFDKTGNPLTAPVALGTFLGDTSNSGDPIIMYDQLADRWFVSEFDDNPQSTRRLLAAVSTTSDPTGTYNVYSFQFPQFPDYPHYSVWPDAYYLTANIGGGITVFAIDRSAMIAGDPDPELVGFNLPGLIRAPGTIFSPEPSNLLGTDLPPAGSPAYIVYLQDDGWTTAIPFDHVKIWEINVDFGGASTISAPLQIPVAPFEATFFPFGQGDVRQPGTNQRIDNINSVISYMANYRVFPTHNSFLFNFNVDLGGNISGIRWIELRNTGIGPFTLFQEGTWTLNDGENRFMGSMGMDQDGNIGLAYNVGSTNTPVGIRFTGRLDGDPLGEMSFQEQVIQNGLGIQNNINRFGDYAQMTMDPDGETFWHTAEYFKATNFWTTRVASFNLDGLPLLSSSENISNDASLLVYPNASNGYEILINSVPDLEDPVYKLIDLQGKIVMSGELISGSDGHRATFSGESLSSGVYVVNVTDGRTFEATKKLVVN